MACPKYVLHGTADGDTMVHMKLKLRQKIFLHFLIFMAVNGAIWFFNYYSNSKINEKLIIIEKKKDLLDTVLEARRYEKNFFLRKDEEDLALALRYIEETARKQQIIEADFAHLLEDLASVQKRSRIIADYRRQMEKLYNFYHVGITDLDESRRIDRIQQTVTQLGRQLTTDIEMVEQSEKERVYKLLDISRDYLVASLLSLFILTLLTAFFLVKNVNRPLKRIEQGIRRIAKGEFDKIPKMPTGDEFESLADSLNHMIRELEKRKDQLVQAEKMSSLGTLTSGVAHELNNPLNNISTSVQIIKEEIEEPDIDFKRNLLTEVEEQIDRARDIIRALLEFSRQSKFSVEPVVFKNLVRSTMHLITSEIPPGITVRIEVADDIEGKMDPRRIQQVLLNLIINAVHAMDDNGTLTISACRDDAAREFVFSVSDTGEGIPKDHLSRIFDPFFTTRDVGKGSGLGLSIIHGIIKQHGGTVTVDSSQGKGTEFSIRLPD